MMDWPLMKNSIDEEQKQAMIDIGCPIGQGFLMHKPEFLETFNK